MFSTVDGGVEQVFMNYTRSLELQKNHVISIIHPWAHIKKQCSEFDLRTMYSYGSKDFIAVRRLRKLIEQEKPDCVITHTRRAAHLVQQTQTQVPKIGVCHTIELYDELKFLSDAIITITHHMHQELIKCNSPVKSIYTVPNMVYKATIPDYKLPEKKSIPVIGACARFSELKGLDVFIKALAELKQRGHEFKAKIAGDGKQKKQYLQLIKQLDLVDQVSLLGWINDTQTFYESLDIFCHPSLKESFGLVVVEGMMHSLPLVLTEISGPKEIIGSSESAIMVPPSDPVALANGLEYIIRDNNLARKLSYNGYQRSLNYTMHQVAPTLDAVIKEICGI